MRLIIQRVTNASVTTQTGLVGEIYDGVFVLIGIKKGDTKKDADQLAKKLISLRIMQDENGKMNRSVVESGAHILVVSQFTLYANTRDGNRPSFIEAEEPIRAEALYNYFINCLKEKNIKVQTGSFGKYMKITAELDGPVTITLSE